MNKKRDGLWMTSCSFLLTFKKKKAFSVPLHLIKLAEFRSSIVLFSPDVLEHLDPSSTRRTLDLKPVAFKCDYPETR